MKLCNMAGNFKSIYESGDKCKSLAKIIKQVNEARKSQIERAH